MLRMEKLPMFDLIKRWQLRTTSSRPLRFSNRVVLRLEDLETRTLLSSGVIQAMTFNSPLSAVAIVAEPVNLNAPSAQSQQTLSDVVPGGSSSKLLPAQPEPPDPTSAGSARQIRAPIQTGVPSSGTTGSTGQPVLGTFAPIVNTTLDVVLPGVNAVPGPLPPPTGIFPAQNLLPSRVTTPLTPAQQIRAGIVNTTDPYAAFEQTILTKEGFKTASGQEVQAQEEFPSTSGDKAPNSPQNKNQQKPVRASGTSEEEEEQDRPDPSPVSTDDQAALDRYRTDAFFADGVLIGEDQR
jgi:hypothetical protein